MNPTASGKIATISAVLLFVITVATIAVMWQPALWATALPEAAVFCLVVPWLLLYMLTSAELQFQFVLIPLTAIAVWPFAQLAAGTTIYRWATSVAGLYWTAGVAIVFVGLQIFRNSRIRHFYLRALVILGFLLAIVSPLQLFTSEGKIFWLFQAPYSNVAMGPFVYTNQYAAFIELLLPIALTRIFADRAGWRTFYVLAAVVMYASVFASASRTGFVLTSLEILVVPLLAARRHGLSLRQVALSGTVFLGMLIVLGFAVGFDRLVAKLQQKDPYMGRREYAESSLQMIPDRPIYGIGMGNWPTAYPAYAKFDDGLFANQAHNDWAQWAVEGGLPFALLMLSVAVWSLQKAFQTRWGIGVAVVFLQCLVDYPIQRMGVAIVFFSLMGAIAFPDEQGVPGGSVRKRRAERAHR